MNARVLLPLDGSEKDQWALTVGAAFADLAQADIHIVRVVELNRSQPQRRFVERTARKAAERIAVPGGRRASCEIVDSDDVAGTLLQVSESRGANLVVMATRAASGLDRALRGSVADRVVRESLRPVVVAPPGASALRDKPLRLHRALVPVDGSSASLRVVSYLLELPRAAALEIVLLRVVKAEPTGGYLMPVAMPPVELDPGAVPRDKVEWVHVNAEQAKERLDAVADQLRAHGVVTEVRVIERDDPVGTILDAARESHADFIAMTTRGAGGIKRMVLGSVAEQVVRESELPVLLVTPGG
jgi:nucleotide-binding universal stress UspA family protein